MLLWKGSRVSAAPLFYLAYSSAFQFSANRWTAVRAMATTPTMTSSPLSSSATTAAAPRVNLLELASACVACTVTASRYILKIAEEKNTRLKVDGSFVTDADFVAQGVIVQAIQSVSPHVKIMGEESPEEMAEHVIPDVQKDPNAQDILQRSRHEIRMWYHQNHRPQSNVVADDENVVVERPLAQIIRIASEDDPAASAAIATPEPFTPEIYPTIPDEDPEECWVDASRVCVIVDPLDGTKSYAQGDHDCVSILIGIVLDHQPYFGVVGKPFGYTGLPSIRDTGCTTLYGGQLLGGVYVAGDVNPVLSQPIPAQPRAVISSSRSKGVVQDFCRHLEHEGLIHGEPLLISGAGEKSLRLVLQRHGEVLWFYPKPGTSLWDVAAPDALLRVLGGKVTDKFGHELDYSKSREQAENVQGIIACSHASLHAECIRRFQQGDWMERL